MIREEELQYLRANPRFLIIELCRRGIDVQVLDWQESVFEARYGGHRELFQDIDSSLMPFSSSIIAGNKAVCRLMLQRDGVSVPDGAGFDIFDREQIAKKSMALGFPVVIKPALGVQGEGVHMDIESEADVEMALDSIYRSRGPGEVVVESQFVGREYRIFVTKRGDYAVIHRDPAHVFGDGTSSIRELADFETQRRMSPRRNCLCPIALDDEAARFLRRSGRSFESVPDSGEKVYLRNSSNVKMGGFAEDVTDIVHPSAIEIAQRALAAVPGLPYAGVDFMCEDISRPQTDVSYRVLEINSLPGIGMHINPGRGRSRNVAGMLVDMIFPETTDAKLRRVA